MPPPSSGGIAVAQMLGILETRDMARAGAGRRQVPGAEAVHLFSEAGRLAYADRNRYAADTDFVPLPGRGVAEPDRQGLPGQARRADRRAVDGRGAGRHAARHGSGVGHATTRSKRRPPRTWWWSTASGAGLSMTTTVEDAFGSRQMVRGFILNNQLTDFSFDSRDADGPVANRVQPASARAAPCRRPSCSTRQTSKLVLAVGSPGGPAIINYVAKVLVGTLDWGLNVQQAISLPNFGSRNGPTELEAGRFPPRRAEALKARGHAVRSYDMNSGLHGIQRMTIHGQQWWFGGADPRREGVAKGD